MWRRNGLSIVLFALMAVFLVAQALTGWQVHNEELAQHGLKSLPFWSYLTTGHFSSATFENWEKRVPPDGHVCPAHRPAAPSRLGGVGAPRPSRRRAPCRIRAGSLAGAQGGRLEEPLRPLFGHCFLSPVLPLLLAPCSGKLEGQVSGIDWTGCCLHRSPITCSAATFGLSPCRTGKASF